jgi:NADH:ubiquinone oxidoreductase subunit E
MNRQEFKDLVIAEREKTKNSTCKHKICICCGAGCISSGSEAVMKKLLEEIIERG